MRLTATAGMALGLTAAIALAQEPAPRLTFDVGSRLSLNDNPDLAVGGSAAQTSLDTNLGLTLNTTTRDQSFVFDLKGLARLGSDGLTFGDPSLKLAYDRQGANSRLSVSGVFQQSDVDLFEPLVSSDGSVISTDILTTTGTVTSTRADISFATGLQAPLGFDIKANVNDRNYSDTTDPAIYDSTSRGLSLGVQLRMPDRGREISLTASSSASDYQNALQTTRDSRSLSLGVTQDLRPDLKLQATLGQTTATSHQAGVLDSTSTGLTGSLGLDAALANGTAAVTLDLSRDVLGPRQSLSFARSMELPTGTLEATLGLSARSGQDGQLIGNLSYSQKLPTGSLEVSLSRQITVNADSQDVANAVLGLSYEHEVNDISSLGLSVNVFQTGSGGSAGVADVLRQTLTASYSHDLAADWKMTTGYQFRSLDQSSAGRAQSNTVFLTISRKFTLRP